MTFLIIRLFLSDYSLHDLKVAILKFGLSYLPNVNHPSPTMKQLLSLLGDHYLPCV